MTGLIFKTKDRAHELQRSYREIYFFRITRESCLENCLPHRIARESCLERERIAWRWWERERESRTKRKQSRKLSWAEHRPPWFDFTSFVFTASRHPFSQNSSPSWGWNLALSLEFRYFFLCFSEAPLWLRFLVCLLVCFVLFFVFCGIHLEFPNLSVLNVVNPTEKRFYHYHL